MQYSAPPPLPPSRRPPDLEGSDAKPRSGIRWYWIVVPGVLLLSMCGVGGATFFFNIQEKLDQPARQFLRLQQKMK